MNEEKKMPQFSCSLFYCYLDCCYLSYVRWFNVAIDKVKRRLPKAVFYRERG